MYQLLVKLIYNQNKINFMNYIKMKVIIKYKCITNLIYMRTHEYVLNIHNDENETLIYNIYYMY